MPGIKPTQVTFLNHGQQTGEYLLTDSHFDSFDDESYFTHGNPTEAQIEGPVDAQVTFFDDQQFKFDENVLLVSLKRAGTADNPVTVDVAQQRLGPDNHDNGIYKGEQDDFGWVLYKHAKGDWAEQVLDVAGTFANIVAGIEDKIPGAGQWQDYVRIGTTLIQQLQGLNTPGSSDNSQVDNISSVLFGTSN
ncbi:hypothetical protein [Streptomyces sp. WELS2]|uniref:hypothetical protein n=1 Tax=Streptomyces sp. WELS2 TaxID=2749435 RepID=UPI0015F06DDE|nr:hypothetical protein [Streptomyces sp. WELS2]